MASFCLGLNVMKAERETIDCFNIGYPFETHHKHKATKNLLYPVMKMKPVKYLAAGISCWMLNGYHFGLDRVE